MKALSTTDVLQVWERGRAQSAPRKALLLLERACSEEHPEELAELSIGERDARLLELRAMTIGRQLLAQIDCEACGESLELELDAMVLAGHAPVENPAGLVASVDGWRVHFRFPCTADLLAVTDTDDEVAATHLFQRCIMAACRFDRDESPSSLPASVAAAVIDCIDAADPRANIQLALRCPACDHHWSATFDIVSFLWTEIAAEARRMLREVHQLASAYGWREAEILALSPARRQAYLEMTEA